MLSIKDVYDASTSEEERAQIVVDLIDSVQEVLGDAPPPIKVLVALRVAALWSMANSVTAQHFSIVAGRVFADTALDLRDSAKPEDIPK